MDDSSPHLGFTTLLSETVVESLPLRGALPAWLTGSLVRTGPARFEVGTRGFNHWFDGLAMLHRFGLGGGRVSYRNRYLKSQAFNDAAATGRISRREFATDPCRTLFQRVASWFFPTPLTDNGCVNIARWHDAVVSLTETRMPVQFDPATLATVGLKEYDQGAKGLVSTAHPHFDRAGSTHYNFLIDFGWKSQYRLLAIDERTGRQSVVATVPVDKPAYMHSFGMTQRYLVLTEFPLVVSPLKLLLSGQPFIRNYQWRPERGVRFHIVEKQSGRLVRTARCGAFFAFHHINAFEEGDDVVVDIVAWPDASIIDRLYLDHLLSGSAVDPTGQPMRYRIGRSQQVTSEPLAEVQLELPRFDYGRRAGERYRYLYGAGHAPGGQFFDRLVKVDLDQNRTQFWQDAGCYPGEPIFVAAPAAAGEDEGVVLSVVLDARRGVSFLLVLSAADFTELARAETPHHIPFSFHGDYLPTI